MSGKGRGQEQTLEAPTATPPRPPQMRYTEEEVRNYFRKETREHRWGRLFRALDLLALLGIIQGLWGIDIAVFAPQLLFEWVHWGTYLGLMYLQVGVAGVWLYWRTRK